MTEKAPVLWERYDTDDGFYGVVWTLDSDKDERPNVVFRTDVCPLKAIVRAHVERFVEASDRYRFLTDTEWANRRRGAGVGGATNE